MPDFPSPFTWPPPTTAVCSFGSLASEVARLDATLHTNNGVGTWPAANRAIYMPFQLGVALTAYQMALTVAVQSGNLDVGIYDANANRLVSAGSTAVGAAGMQIVDITDTLLVPGTYFAAMCVDNTTASFTRSTNPDVQTMRVCGLQQQAVGAVTLPSTATFATMGNAYYPALTVSFTAAAL